MEAIKRFLKDEEGVTAIEYALIAVGIALVIGLAAATIGGKINVIFTRVGNALT